MYSWKLKIYGFDRTNSKRVKQDSGLHCHFSINENLISDETERLEIDIRYIQMEKWNKN